MKKFNRILFYITLIISFSSCNTKGQESVQILSDTTELNTQVIADSLGKKEVSLLFLGDIMQHGLQIESAYNSATKKYDFTSQFKYVKPIFEKNTKPLTTRQVIYTFSFVY